MLTIGALIFYSLGMFASSALHTKFHRREWGKECTACTAHTYWVPIAIGYYSFLVCSVMILAKNFFQDLYIKIPFLFLFLLVAGMLPVLPLNPLGIHPFPKSFYLISSWTLFGFSLAITFLTSFALAIEEIFHSSPALFMAIQQQRVPILIGVVGIITSAILGPIVKSIINPPSEESAGKVRHLMFRKGESFLIISIALIIIGFVFLIFLPLITWEI